MKKKILNILKYVAFTSLGATLFWLVYRNQDSTQIWYVLVNNVNYFWIIVSLFLGLLSHISRTLRWKIALEPLGENPRTINAFITVMASYFMNLLLPRMGEFIRCGMLSKYEKIPFSKLFGTVITERIVDLIMLLSISVAVLFIEFDKIISFSNAHPQVLEKVTNVLKTPYLWGGLLALALGLFYYLKISSKKNGKNKLEIIINDFVQGIKSVLSMKRYKAYIAHTLFIWLMYFLMLYMVFLSFEPTAHLKPLAGLVTFVMSSFGMVAPVQGGIGAWHFMAESALGLYGIDSSTGKIFALLAHSSMNLMVIIIGSICIILIPIVNRNYKPKSDK